MGASVVTAITSVFTNFIPAFATGLLNMFTGLFYTVSESGGALTPLGEVFLVFIGIAICIGIFRIVYKIFRNRLAKRV